MILLKVSIESEWVEIIEGFLGILEDYHWSVEDDFESRTLNLAGYFETKFDALESWYVLKSKLPFFIDDPVAEELVDQDWKNAYKFHFTPWSCRGLHWIPVWEKNTYAVPEGESALYLDPGMAFGTGNHETTRLCVHRILDCRDDWIESISGKTVIDAGCGSGILSISASLLGFMQISGFDVDDQAIAVSHENAAMNNIDNINFFQADLTDGFQNKQFDLILANILAPTLMVNAGVLLKSLKIGGRLILSGVLCGELDSLRDHYAARAEMLNFRGKFNSRQLGEWSDLYFERLP